VVSVKLRRLGRRAATVAVLVSVLGLPLATDAPAAVAGCGPTPVVGGEWRSYGHDMANTRHQDKELLLTIDKVPTLAPAWTFSSVDAGGAGDFTGTPVIADGCLYVASNSGWVFALNADTGALVWKAQLPAGGGVNSSLTVANGLVYAAVSRTTRAEGCTGDACEGPYVVALSQATGAVVWTSAPIDDQLGADTFASPVVYDGLLLVGVSGGAAELGDEADRYAFQGSLVILDAATGALVRKTWTIHSPDAPDDGFAGGAIWSTPAIDVATKTAFVGAGNPFQYEHEHANTNAVLRFDVDRASPTFGEITGSYKGDVDEYLPVLSQAGCTRLPVDNPLAYPEGIGSCGDIDLDFGASPNLFAGPDGRLLVGTGQKSGVYHVFDAATMAPVWKTLVGPPTPVGGIVGSTAIDDENVYGPVTVPGHLWSVSKAGTHRWLAPTADAVHWGNPVAAANGVVYTVDFKGFLDAYDARVGAPLLHRPLALGSATGSDPVLSWAGVSIARGTVYAAVGISGLSDGFVIALRPGASGGGGPLPAPPAPPSLPGPPGGLAGGRVVAGPGAVATTYATTTVTIPRGGSLTFTNLDVPQHDVVADNGSFRSPLIGPGASTPVGGVEALAPGSYGFFCSLHRNMRGTLNVT
jgi:polyvinyl alcohol dehydrogenase (cytochrome)